MDDCKVGVIGIGNIGYIHAKSFYSGQVKGAKLAAVCDIDIQKRTVVENEFPGVAYYSDYKQMLIQADIDAVIVAIPHPLHSEAAICAFEHGKHVLVEKPVDIYTSKARKLNEAARRSGKVFGVMFNQRTHSLFVKAKQLVQEGALGEIKRSVWIITNWYRTQFYYDSGSWRATWAGEGGGVLVNQAPHQLDLWQWICGMPQAVTAFCTEGKYHNIEVEDDATIFAQYANGAEGVFITTTGESPGTNRLEISGTKGKLVLENGVMKWWKLSCDERICNATEQKSFVEIPFTYEQIPEDPESPGHRGILQNFTDAILYGKPLIAPGYEAINSVTIQNAAYLSAWKGNTPVAIPFDEKEFDAMLDMKRKESRIGTEGTTHDRGDKYHARWQTNW